MPPAPLVITFPVFDMPPDIGGPPGKVVGLRASSLPPGGPGDPEMVVVEGMHENGRMVEIVMPVTVWHRACSPEKARTFIETDDRRSGIISLKGQPEPS